MSLVLDTGLRSAFAVLILSRLVWGNQEDGFISRFVSSGSQPLQTSFQNQKVPCTCGIFLESQYNDDHSITESTPAYLREFVFPMLPCGYRGSRSCQDRCLDEIIPHLHEIGPLMCSAIERNCFRERAALFTKNCDNVWTPSGLTLGREFCCINGLQIKCPRNWFGQSNLDISTRSSSVFAEILESPSEPRKSLSEAILHFGDRAVELVTNVFNTKK